MASRLTLLGLLFVVACGGSSTTTGSSNGGVTAPSSDPVTLPDGTTVPSVSCGDQYSVSATGTWDIIQTIGGEVGTATLTLTNTTFSFSSSPVSLTFDNTNGATATAWTDPEERGAVNITTTQTPSTLDLGIIPLALGGSWSFGGPGTPSDGCGATLGDGTFTTTCTNVSTARFGRLDTHVTGTRTSTKASVFGSLGGVWQLTSDTGTGKVDATLSGNVFTAVILGNARPLGSDGWVTVKICNDRATGLSSDGAELAGTRR